MALVVQFANTAALGAVGLLVWFYLRGRFDQIDRCFEELKQDVNRQFDNVTQEVDRRSEQNDRQHDRLASEIAGLRSDITQIALLLGARTRPEANQA